MGDGQTKILFLTPHPPVRAPSPQGEGDPSLNREVDSATPGKPCVQNDMLSGVRLEYETLPTTYIDR